MTRKTNSRGQIITCTCTTCGHTHRISEREIALFKGMVETLWRVFRWCKEKDVHEFERKDIEHLLRSYGDMTRFPDWKMFGGLVYDPIDDKGERKGKKYYGINVERCDAFFRGEYKIPTRIWKNPVTKALRLEEYKSVREIPKLVELLDSDGWYIANYREPRGDGTLGL